MIECELSGAVEVGMRVRSRGEMPDECEGLVVILLEAPSNYGFHALIACCLVLATNK